MGYDVERTLRPELGPGEKLLWSGQPRGGLRLRGTDAMMIPFSLLWGGFAVFWELSVIHTNAPFFFRLWGVPFVLVGLYVVVGRFFADAYLRSRTMYGLTNQRVIIVAGFTGRQTKSLPLRTLNDLSLNERDDRSGTITFGTALSPYAWMNSGWPGMARYRPPAFEMIDNVRSVFEQIRSAQAGQSSTG
ncbi:MAG TPA: hypothetical protein VIE46_10260 [Gemmatimonadales bacterium]